MTFGRTRQGERERERKYRYFLEGWWRLGQRRSPRNLIDTLKLSDSRWGGGWVEIFYSFPGYEINAGPELTVARTLHCICRVITDRPKPGEKCWKFLKLSKSWLHHNTPVTGSHKHQYYILTHISTVLFQWMFRTAGSIPVLEPTKWFMLTWSNKCWNWNPEFSFLPAHLVHRNLLFCITTFFYQNILLMWLFS